MHNTGYTNTCTVYNSQLSCFEELTESELKIIEENKVVVNYKKGENICKQGSFASHIIYLREGLAKVYLEGNPKNLVLKITPSGNLIGLPSIYEGNNVFLYSAATYTDSTVELKDFKDDGLIETNGKSIKIVNYEMMNRISEVG